MSEKNLLYYLENNSQLQSFAKQAKKLQQLETTVFTELNSILTPSSEFTIDHNHYKNAIQIANYSEGTLSLIIHDASLATHFRFYILELQQKLKQHQGFCELKKINYQISPVDIPKSNKQSFVKPQKHISEKNEQILKQILDTLKE